MSDYLIPPVAPSAMNVMESQYVTRLEFDQAISDLKQDIRDTQQRIEPHLDKQDTKLNQIYNWTVFGLYGTIAAIIGGSAAIVAALLVIH